MSCPLSHGGFAGATGAVVIGQDLLLAAVFPLVTRKAFGRTAGLLALGLGLVTLTGMLVLLDLRLVQITLPAMVALGPLTQYLVWQRRLGVERTTLQYQQEDIRNEREGGPGRSAWPRTVLCFDHGIFYLDVNSAGSEFGGSWLGGARNGNTSDAGRSRCPHRH